VCAYLYHTCNVTRVKYPNELPGCKLETQFNSECQAHSDQQDPFPTIPGFRDGQRFLWQRDTLVCVLHAARSEYARQRTLRQLLPCRDKVYAVLTSVAWQRVVHTFVCPLKHDDDLDSRTKVKNLRSRLLITEQGQSSVTAPEM